MMRNISIWLGSSLLLLSAFAFGQQEAPEEVVVTGRLPGPALWKVSNGDNVLWIFAALSPIPKDMVWESQRVEKVIAEADEFIDMPDAHISVSTRVMLNPINYVRAFRLMRRITRNPDNKSLREVLPPELYQRFAALKAQYLPESDDLETLRPLSAVGRMDSVVLKKNGLAANDVITNKIRRLADRNRHIKRTSADVTLELEGGYSTLAERAETLVNTMPLEHEIGCMDFQITLMESGIEAMKSRANSWAQGHMDDFRDAPRLTDAANPCVKMIMASSEVKTAAELMASTRQKWLAAAEQALANNHSTFAVLGIEDLFSENGLLAELKARGYGVREP